MYKRRRFSFLQRRRSSITPRSRYSTTGRRRYAKLLAPGLAALALVVLFFIAADWYLPASAARKYGYDPKGRVISRTTSNGKIIKYQYSKEGLVTDVSYQKLGAVTHYAYPGGDAVRYEYDAAGNRVAMNDGLGKTQYAYDAYDRLEHVITADGKKLSYEYDPWNHLKRITLPDQYLITYQYDLLGNVTEVADGQAVVRYEQHGDLNQVYRKLPNGITSIFEYSAVGQLTAIRHQQPDNAVISAYRYQRDPEGRVRQVEETTPKGITSTNYEYDFAGRVVKVVQSDGSIVTYEYDLLGNRISQTEAQGTTKYEYDPQARLIRAGDTTFAYDAAGNLVSRKGKTQSSSYKYDDENRLLEVHNGKNTLVYTYDGEGNRVRREVNGEVTNYVNETFMGLPQVMGEYGKDGRMSHYTLGQSRIGRRNEGGEAVYFLEDHLGSTRCIVDAHGKVLARYVYSPFGVPTLTEGAAQTDYLYAGEAWDADAQLLYLHSRYYDPELGRFLSPDPLPGSLLVPESFNQYVYVNDDPINRVDPSGLRDGPLRSEFRAGSWPLLLQMPPRPPQPPPLHLPSPRTSSTPRTSPSPPSYLQPYSGRNFDYIVAYSGGSALFPYLHNFGITSSHPVINLGGAAYSGAVNVRSHWDPVPRVISLLGLGQSHSEYRVAASSGWNPHDLASNYLPALGSFPANSSVLYIDGIHLRKNEPSFDPAGSIGRDFFPRDTSVVAPYGHGLVRDLWDAFTTFRSADPDRGRSGLFDFFQSRDLDDDQRKYYSPFPPGGGGSGAPSVGGVYLDQAARVIGELGAITGAVYDPAKGQLILVGERNTKLPPMKPEYLADAIRVVYSTRQTEPGMTIDPKPQNPRGPEMDVKFFGNTENSRLGWVMFESDRVMKGYSVGSDNITKQPVQSSVPGYQSVNAMGLANGLYNPNLWSRFWLVPEPVLAHVGGDGQTIMFDPIRMCVKTETMRWAGGQLVPAVDKETHEKNESHPCWENGKVVFVGDNVDANAEAFARHFTENYEKFSEENGIYGELAQVAQAVALAKWMKEKDIPVDWGFVRLYRSAYSTPSTTPSASFQLSEQFSVGGGLGTRIMSSFGGVNMSPHIQSQKVAEVDKFHEELINQWTAAQKLGKISFRFKFNNKEFEGVAMPASNEREVAGYDLAESDVKRCLAVSPEMALLPGLTRHYNSTHSEPTELGFSWSLLVPRLEFESAGAEGRTDYVSIAGDDATRVVVQRFVLTNQFGMDTERFVTHFVDQELARIGFASEKGTTVYRGLYPEKDGSYRLIFQNGEEDIFDARGNLRAILKAGSKAIYDYDQENHLTSIHLSHDAREEEIRFEWNGKGQMLAAVSGDTRNQYQYDEIGNLNAAICGGQTTSYRYNEKRLLTEVSVDGTVVVENGYDDLGRLLKQKTPSGGESAQQVEATAAGKVVTVKQGMDVLKKYYDAQQRLTSIEDSNGNIHRYSYDTAGRLARVEEILPSEASTQMEISADQKMITIQSARGARLEYHFDEHNHLSEVILNNKRTAVYRYDERDRLSEVSYENGGSESFTYDEKGQVLEYRRQTAGDQRQQSAELLQFSYDDAGDLSGVSHPAVGQIRFLKEPNRIMVAQGNASFQYEYDGNSRLTKVEAPDGLTHNYTYTPAGVLSVLELLQGNNSRRIEFNDGSVITRNSMGGQTKYSYAPSGRINAVLTSYGALTSYSYDNDSRLQRVELPDGRCLDYFYDSATGRLREERASACKR